MHRLSPLLLVATIACIPQLEAADEPLSIAGGFEVGDTVPELVLKDQHDEDFVLYDHEGDVILLDISTMWCGPCQALAVFTQETYEAYEKDGFMYVTILQQDLHNDVPDQADLNEWADSFGIETPVLADGGDDPATSDAIQNNQFPALLVVGRDLVIVERVNPPVDSAVRAAIEAAL